MSENDLLVDAVFTSRFSNGRVEKLSLPGVLAGLSAGLIDSFDKVQAHQSHPWHAFLVQVAAMALGEGSEVAPVNESAWRELLLQLSEGEPSAWMIFEPDLMKPAFLQNPVKGSLADFKPVHSPTQLDLLDTAKNFDVKAQRDRCGGAEHWVMALIGLQTFTPWGGKTHYSIVRMNGNYGSRMNASFVPSLRASVAFGRDVSILRRRTTETAADVGFNQTSGIRLTWLVARDAATEIALQDCHPWFIESARRVRFVSDRMTCMKAGQDGRFVRSGACEGVVGDPWVPVNRAEGKCLTPSRTTFLYPSVSDLLSGDRFSPAICGSIQGTDAGELLFVVGGRVGGTTNDGFFERTVPIPARAIKLISQRSDRDRLLNRHRSRMNDVELMFMNLWRPTIQALLGVKSPKEKLGKANAETIQRLNQNLEGEIDLIFFEKLWTDFELEALPAQRSWQRCLCNLARSHLERAISSVSVKGLTHYERVSRALAEFKLQQRKHFPAVFEVEGDPPIEPLQEIEV